MERREFTHSKSKMSMSDTESQTSQMESFYSPIRSDSPLRSDDPEPPPDGSPAKSPAPPKVVDALGKYNSPLRSPALDYHKALASTENLNVQANPQPAVLVVNRAMREDLATGVTRLGPLGGGDEYGGEERRSRAAVAAMRRLRREVALNKAALGFRVCEVILCLISFSVMAADKSRGWSGDSFDRYKEYRYCLSVNVIAFVYSGCQTCDLAYYLNSGKHLFLHRLRYHFDFSMDQILAYLLMSASSSAATRVDDWVSNWGKDEFTKMASASIAMSFLAFFAFALSSLISGYNLCNYSIT